MHRTLLNVVIYFLSFSSSAFCYVNFFAPFNAIGLKGNITFRQDKENEGVYVSINLMSIVEMKEDATYSWKIMSFPYFPDSKCGENLLGKVEHEMSSRHGLIKVPFSGQLSQQIFIDSEISLKGAKTIWSSSLIIVKTGSDQSGCANIINEGDVQTVKSIFMESDFVGSIIFRENELGDTIILSNLFHASNEFKINSQHDWKILVTDVFDRPRENKCNYLQDLLDPDYVDDTNCSENNHLQCKMGSLTSKHGKLTIFKGNGRSSKQKFVDTNLPLSLLSGSRDLYVVIYKKDLKNQVFGCAKMELIAKREVKTLIDMDGLKGHIRFSQSFHTDPTIVTINLENNRHRGHTFSIHQFPVQPRMRSADQLCSINSIGSVYNPSRVSSSKTINQGTVDQYAIGDLSGKYGPLQDDEKGNIMQIHVDLKLPLFGVNSIIGRSLAISKPDGSRWVCATIGYPAPVITAIARFNFPLVGHVIMKQEMDKPRAETTVFVDLSYSDGNGNDTRDHKWAIHDKIVGLDFYNWTARCLSAGDLFNPFKIGSGRGYSKECSFNNPYRCVVGDLTSKSNHLLKIAGFRGSLLVKHFYTDLMIPLSSSASIIGKSLIVFDEKGPKQRGDRLGCTTIKRLHPLVAAVRTWTGSKSKFSGSIVFNQSTIYDATYGKLDLAGLDKEASGFHVHEVRISDDKEFPCSQDSVYDHFNPFNLDSSVTPYPGIGSSDQYQVGDLSGKLGLLDDKISQRCEFIDTNLPLHGPNSIIGRSIVIHKKEKGDRWLCGSLEAGERKDSAKEIIALATFDDPQHLISGYIRFRQFEYKDSSLSDTWMEISLRHQGVYNRNITHNHKWAIYVNQVGHDAFIKDAKTRCIAAGYRWNPYFVDSERNRPLYEKDCNPLNPLRCELGDLSGKNGPLIIGGKRVVISDSNLPLIGFASIVGRSLIIFDPNGSDQKLACTRILPDYHLISNIAVQNNAKLTVAKLMEDMRKLLDTSDWLVKPEIRTVKAILDNECLQLTIHFYGKKVNNLIKQFNAESVHILTGPEAFRLQTEFNNLLSFGQIVKHDRLGARRISTFYQPCRPLISNSSSPLSAKLILILAILLVNIFNNMK